MKQTYIEWLYPGIITSDTATEKVNDRTIPGSFPKGTFGFRFFDRTEVKSTDGEDLNGKPQNYSGWYYLGGEKLTLAEVKEKHPDKKILISNMEGNKINEIILTKYGQAMQLNNGDIILSET